MVLVVGWVFFKLSVKAVALGYWDKCDWMENPCTLFCLYTFPLFINFLKISLCTEGRADFLQSHPFSVECAQPDANIHSFQNLNKRGEADTSTPLQPLLLFLFCLFKVQWHPYRAAVTRGPA